MGPGGTPALTTCSPARPQSSRSWVADLRTWLSEAGHSRGSPEKALPSAGTANPQPSLAVSSKTSLPNSNEEIPWANQQLQRARGVLWLLPLPSAGLETRVLRFPGPISGGTAMRGVSVRVPTRSPWPPPLLSGRRPTFIDVSPQGERGFAGRDWGEAAFLPWGAAAAGPAAYT